VTSVAVPPDLDEARLEGTTLDGVAVHVDGDSPTHRLIRQHLLRLGAHEVDRVGADVLVVGDGNDDWPASALVCRLEDLRLDDGGLVASETTAQAALGLPDFVGPSGGRPDRTGADIASSIAAFLAVQTICAARFGLPGAGAGSRFRTSPLRALGLLKSPCFAARSRPDEWVGTHVVSREKGEDSGYRTSDGWITLDFPEGAVGRWRSYCEAIGVPDAFVESHADSYMQTVGWGDDIDEARPVYEACLAGTDSADAMATVVEHGGSSVPFLSVDQCLGHPQARAVGLDRSFATGVPFRIEATGDGPVGRTDRRGSPGRPLDGLRVVDLGIGGVGPFAPMILGRLGADVVKVEPPFDFVHTIGPWVDGLSTTYMTCNATKRSVPLNLKDAADREAFLELVAGADVLNANFRPGALDRLGIGFDDLVAVNPSIVLATTTGYGWAGPMSDQPCTDPHAQAFGGFADLNRRTAADQPRRCRYVGFIDFVTSTIIAEGITAALLVRDRVGGAILSQTSMMHAVAETSQTLRDGSPPCGPDDVYRAADGHFALTCRSEDDWRALLRVLPDRSAVSGDVFSTAGARHALRDELRDRLEEQFSRRAALAWVQALARAGVPAVRVIDDDEAMARVDYRRAGLIGELRPGNGRAPLAVGGGSGLFDGAPVEVVLDAPVPGMDGDQFAASPADFWLGPAVRNRV